MKRNQKIAIALLAIATFYGIFVSVSTEFQRQLDELDELETNTNDEIVDTTNSVIIAPTLEFEDISNLDFTDDIADVNNETLIKVNSSMPFSDGGDEFSVNLNEYYENARLKVVDYLNYEGFDLAVSEKALFGEEFSPLQYNEKFQITYRDENLVSIMRTTTIITNETEYTTVKCEILDTKDATLVLITDISENFLEKLAENAEINYSIDDLDYYLTDEGIFTIYLGNNQLFEYENLELSEKYAYLGELNATN
ncbi:MAG: hypothetical protein R3Y12_06795 [Clostridia bacterium]